MTSELMRATVAKPQGDAGEGGAERSGRQTRDHKDSNEVNRSRGWQWATSVLGNTKSNPHQDTASRAGWHAGKVQGLTRGGLPCENEGGVSRGHSNEHWSRGRKHVRLNYDTGTLQAEKDQRNQPHGSTEDCAQGNNQLRSQQSMAARRALHELHRTGRCSRPNPVQESKPGRHA